MTCIPDYIDNFISRVMPVLLAARSSLTPTAAGVPMGVVLSRARTSARWIALLHTLLAGWPSPWWRRVCAAVSSSRCPMPSVLLSHWLSSWPAMVQEWRTMTSCSRLSSRTSTCVQVASWSKYIYIQDRCENMIVTLYQRRKMWI